MNKKETVCLAGGFLLLVINLCSFSLYQQFSEMSEEECSFGVLASVIFLPVLNDLNEKGRYKVFMAIS
jgi:hypothetical protein